MNLLFMVSTWISVVNDEVEKEDDGYGDESHWPAYQKHTNHAQGSC